MYFETGLQGDPIVIFDACVATVLWRPDTGVVLPRFIGTRTARTI
jgi:hypothetical protein